MKKFLAVLLTACMLLALLPAGVFANTEETVVEANYTVNNQTELNTAMQNAATNSVIAIATAGTYTISYSNKSLSFIGTVDGVNISVTSEIGIYGSISFENVTITYAVDSHYKGFAHTTSETYTDCVINGQMFSYGDTVTFTDCKFYQTAVYYNIWTYGSENVTFTTCEFNGLGKALLVFKDGDSAPLTVTVNDCDFTATAKADGKAAIEIDTSNITGNSSVIIDSLTTSTGFDVGEFSNSSLWHDKKNLTNVTVTVANEKVWPIAVAKIGDEDYYSLASAVAAVPANGSAEITLVNNTEEQQVSINNGKNITIKGATKDITFKGQLMVTSKLKLENITLKPHNAAIGSTSQYMYAAIALMNTGDVECNNVVFELTDGVTGQISGISAWWSTGDGANITVKNSIFNCYGERPIRSDACVTVENCVFNDPYRYAVQMTSKADTASELEIATVNFKNNVINGGASGKNYIYGIQLEGETYGNSNLSISGSGNKLVPHSSEDASECFLYYCECGKVEHNTIEWDVEAPVACADDEATQSNAITITFDINGEETEVSAIKATTVEFPEVSLANYDFNGWLVDGKAVDESYIFYADTTVTANLTEHRKIAITFNADGGEEVEGKEIYINTAYGELPTTTKENYTFGGWYNGETKVDATTVFTASTTLTAKWTENAKYDVTFIVDDETVETYEIYTGNTLTEMPEDPSKDFHDFAGWYDENDNEVTLETVITSDVTVTAKWTEHDKVTVTFIDGETTVDEQTIYINTALEALPEIGEKEGYTFIGWFDADENEVTTDKIYTESTEVYAKWLEVVVITPPSDDDEETPDEPEITITVDEVKSDVAEIDDAILSDLDDEQKTEIETIVNEVDVDANAVSDVIKTETADIISEIVAKDENNNNITDIAKEALNADDDDDINIIIKPIIEVKLVEYTPTKDGNHAELTFDITPTYQVIATTETNPDKINEDNSKVIDSGKLDTVGKEITVKIKLPKNFAEEGNTVYGKHKHDNNGSEQIHRFRAVVKADGNGDLYIEYKNKNGFSEIELSVVNDAVAVINGVDYSTLQDAVNAAADGNVIILNSDNAENITINRNVEFYILTSGHKFSGRIKSAERYIINVEDNDGMLVVNVKEDTTPAFIYNTAYIAQMIQLGQSYTITASAGEGGTISNAGEKTVYYGRGANYYIKADEGYAIESVIVNGVNVGAVEKFTFDNVVSDNTIEAVFVKLPWKSPYKDVDEMDVYFDGVAYVTENGIMNGVSYNRFAPLASVKRGDMLSIMWNVAGAQGTDAIAWATEAGIIAGDANENGLMTTEMMYVFVYRLAKAMGIPTVGSVPVDGDVSDWAADALAWANAMGIYNGADAKANATRADVAMLIAGVANLIG